MRLRILRPGLSSPSFPPQLRWMQTLSLEVLEAELAKLVPVRTWLRDTAVHDRQAREVQRCGFHSNGIALA